MNIYIKLAFATNEELNVKSNNNLLKNTLRIAILDGLPFSNWYSTHLAEKLSKLMYKKGLLFYYAPKNKKLNSNISYKFRSLWSSNLWPLQVIRQSIKDNINLIHIQFEFSTFGPLYSSLLITPFLLISKLLNFKTVTTLHGPIFPKNSSNEIISNILPNSLIKFNYIIKTYIIFTYIIISKLSSAIIVHDPIFKRMLRTYGIKNSNSIPHGIEKIEKVHTKSNYLLESESHKKFILCFGVLSPRKGLEYLIQAFAKLSKNNFNVKLIIAGKESSHYRSYKNKLIQLVHTLKLTNKVIFTGYLSDIQVNEIYQQADILALPYPQSRGASGPLSLAMAHGKPIIATDTGYFSEILEDNVDALLVPPKDTHLLSNAMEILICNEKLRAKLSKNIKLKAEKSYWVKVAQTTANLYQRLL